MQCNNTKAKLSTTAALRTYDYASYTISHNLQSRDRAHVIKLCHVTRRIKEFWSFQNTFRRWHMQWHLQSQVHKFTSKRDGPGHDAGHGTSQNFKPDGVTHAQMWQGPLPWLEFSYRRSGRCTILTWVISKWITPAIAPAIVKNTVQTRIAHAMTHAMTMVISKKCPVWFGSKTQNRRRWPWQWPWSWPWSSICARRSNQCHYHRHHFLFFGQTRWPMPLHVLWRYQWTMSFYAFRRCSKCNSYCNDRGHGTCHNSI